MPLPTKPIPTTFQVGDTVYVPSLLGRIIPGPVVISKTRSEIINDTQSNIYYFVGYGNTSLPESKVFASKVDLETYTDGLIDAL